MVYLKRYLTLLVFAGLLFSCSEDDSQMLTEEQNAKIEFERIREKLANNMLDLVTESKPIMLELKKKRQAKGAKNEIPPFEEYLKELPNGVYLSDIGVDIAKASYDLIKNNASDSEIINGYDASELFVLAKKMDEGKTFDEVMLSSDTPDNVKAKSTHGKGFWGKVWKGIKSAWNWLWSNHKEVLSILTILDLIGVF
jgi:hypothetical protein